jgi:hypothetical protein
MRNNRMVAGFPTVFLAAAAILALALRQGPPASSAQATPTPYHAGQPSPVASPHAMTPTVYPLPLPQDPASAGTMTAAGAAMIQAAAGMAEAATTMTATDVPCASAAPGWCWPPPPIPWCTTRARRAS